MGMHAMDAALARDRDLFDECSPRAGDCPLRKRASAQDELYRQWRATAPVTRTRPERHSLGIRSCFPLSITIYYYVVHRKRVESVSE